ncbi:integrase family protein [Candidatus Kaiserbacteria bacterium]|nr:integrase family protein [Candidatus Kaiserbacteria bacterium]
MSQKESKQQGGKKEPERTYLTSGRIKKFSCPPDKTQVFLWDTDTSGLAVRCTVKGGKAYIFQSKIGTKAFRMTIGSIKDWTIGDAREEARRFQHLVDRGIDPRHEKRANVERQNKKDQERKAAKLRDQLIVETPWFEYLEHHQKRWSDRHYRDHVNLSKKGGEPMKRGNRKTVQGVLYPLLQMRMVDISAAALKSWQVKEAEERANNARQGYELFRAFWRWCASHPDYQGIVDASVVENRDLRAEVPKRATKRFDVLERGQLKAWFNGVTALSNPVISTYLQALLLTGARRNEMTGLKWADVDFQWNAVWLKDKVHEEGRKVPLTPYLALLINSLPRRNQWVFSSPTAESGRMTEPTRAHKRALSSAGLDVVTLHGLRRTFASLAEWVEMPRGVVAQIMGHAPNATAERHYINRPLDLLAIWHNKYEAWILEQAGIEFEAQSGVERLRVIQ